MCTYSVQHINQDRSHSAQTSNDKWKITVGSEIGIGTLNNIGSTRVESNAMDEGKRQYFW